MKSLLIASAISLFATGALAQEAGQTQAAAPAETAATPAQDAAPAAAAVAAAPTTTFAITEDELKRFATVANETRKISADFQPRISGAPDAATRDKETSDMATLLALAAQKHGFTVQRYNEIATAAHSDQGLAAMIINASRSVTRTSQAASPASAPTP